MNKNFFTVTCAAIVLALCLAMCQRPEKQQSTEKPTKVVSKEVMHIRPLTNIKYEVTPERLKQGKYLTNSILHCFACHSPRNLKAPGAPPIPGKNGSGTIMFKDSTMLIVPPNITSDKETGAGTWTDDMFARAIREGVGHDGRVLYWLMRSTSFRNLSDEELASVVVYIRSLPPVHNTLPKTQYSAEERSAIEKTLRPITQPVSAVDQSNPIKRGRHLVMIGDCKACHTSEAASNPGIFGGGNVFHFFNSVFFSANISPDPSGITYGQEAFIFTIRTGKGGTLNPIMPWTFYKNMSDADLRAIYSYLRTLPPAHHYVNSIPPFTHCAICGLNHGLGKKNKIETLSGIKLNPDITNLYAGTYLNEDTKDTYTITKKGDKLVGKTMEKAPEVELIPQSQTHFLAPGWPMAVNFVKDKDGHITELVEDTDYGRVFKKIK